MRTCFTHVGVVFVWIGGNQSTAVEAGREDERDSAHPIHDGARFVLDDEMVRLEVVGKVAVQVVIFVVPPKSLKFNLI